MKFLDFGKSNYLLRLHWWRWWGSLMMISTPTSRNICDWWWRWRWHSWTHRWRSRRSLNWWRWCLSWSSSRRSCTLLVWSIVWLLCRTASNRGHGGSLMIWCISTQLKWKNHYCYENLEAYEGMYIFNWGMHQESASIKPTCISSLLLLCSNVCLFPALPPWLKLFARIAGLPTEPWIT